MSCCHPNPAKACCKEGGWHMKIHLKTLLHIPSNQPTSPRQCISSTFLYNSLLSSPNQLRSQSLLQTNFCFTFLKPACFSYPQVPFGHLLNSQVICLQTDLLSTLQPTSPSQWPPASHCFSSPPKPLLSSFQKTLSLLLPYSLLPTLPIPSPTS